MRRYKKIWHFPAVLLIWKWFWEWGWVEEESQREWVIILLAAPLFFHCLVTILMHDFLPPFVFCSKLPSDHQTTLSSMGLFLLLSILVQVDATIVVQYCFSCTVPAQILRQFWLERHVSILFSKICQFLTFYLVKSSPKNPRWKLERRCSICAGTVFTFLIDFNHFQI